MARTVRESRKVWGMSGDCEEVGRSRLYVSRTARATAGWKRILGDGEEDIVLSGRTR